MTKNKTESLARVKARPPKNELKYKEFVTQQMKVVKHSERDAENRMRFVRNCRVR